MKMSERVRDLRHRVADIMGGVTGPQDYELDGTILASFEEVARTAERAAIERAAQACQELTERRAAEMGLAHYDHLTGHRCVAAIRALLPPVAPDSGE